MNLKNNQITIRELMANPASNALLHKRFPQAMKHPLAVPAQSLTLAQTMEFARRYLPQSTINEVLQELKNL